MNNNNNEPRKSSGLWKTAIVAVVSAVIGGGVAYGGFSLANRNNGQSTDTALTTQSKTSGSTKVSNVTVNASTQMTKAFDKNKAAVVSVINLQKQNSNSSSDDPFSSLFGSGSSGRSSKGSSDSSSSDSLAEYSEGSGLIYSKSDGKAYIVTNNHVVSGSDSLQVIMSDGTKLTAKLVGTDELTDLAVLSIDASKVSSVATFGNSDSINPGEPVIAIGSPLGSEYATSVTEGIISAKSRTMPVTDESTGQETGTATVIQTDAAINPGNSGGPLVNSAGQVIGINSMKLAQSNDGTSVEGMGFAIPSNEVVKIINQLVQNGKVTRPALGVSVVDLTQVSAAQQSSILKLPDSVKNGAVVTTVSSGSAAANAGLKKYDVITALGDTSIESIAQLHTTLYNYNVGDKVQVTYYRDGKKATTTVTLDKASDTQTGSTDRSNANANG
ncbi:serine protease HtrA [Agrilactobacillus composti DSM 18527 = JCM 14202]|uniref:Serine protease HtrA n=1 Tax=Agrilactobacillus composti DSM 18527 = JCM 14202 TaxID=1423734 RepID=A0A0R1Y032_9LACO|nr:trypsin-like peptidase domain-containing protein [Agrilactobacillus composti]KRM32982.1 serine protease HtrA [Agrilactobacillus composti DSM 18527 = JCM 14202]